MRVGLDFDNTIVRYDRLFHMVARERGLVPATLAPTKLGVRDHLRSIGQEDAWTEMQGSVYGPRMRDAELFPGVIDFLRAAKAAGVWVWIVSHRTRYPFLGPQHDLHEAARRWVETSLLDHDGPLIPPERVFFELTKDKKIARIAELGCDWFVDDLPEILLAPQFPERTGRVLFDPDNLHPGTGELTCVSSWDEIAQHVAAAHVG